MTKQIHPTGMLDRHTEPYFHCLREASRLTPKDIAATQQIIESFLFGDGAVALLLGPGGDDDSVLGPFSHVTNDVPSDLELLYMTVRPQFNILMMNQSRPRRSHERFFQKIHHPRRRPERPSRLCGTAPFLRSIVQDG